MIEIGLIGAGFFGEMHARAIADVQGIRLRAVSRRNKDELEKIAVKYGAEAYTDWRELLTDPKIDAVIIATPHHYHTEIALEAAAAGKGILLEKPLAPSLQECRKIGEAVRRNQVKFMAGFINHFVRAYSLAKEMIMAGEIGNPVIGRSVMYKRWMEPNRRRWHFDRSTGGGMWLTAGIHCLDRLTWLLDQRVERVSAHFGTAFHRQQADDHQLMLLHYSGGIAGMVTSVGYSTGAPDHETEIVGTRGIMRIDAVRGIKIGRNEVWQEIPDTGSMDVMHEALVGQWSSFRDVILKDSENSASIDFALHIMEVVFAAEQSARDKTEISIPDRRI